MNWRQFKDSTEEKYQKSLKLTNIEQWKRKHKLGTGSKYSNLIVQKIRSNEPICEVTHGHGHMVNPN